MLEPDRRKVFVVHGRNRAAKAAVEAVLRAVALQPLEWEQARQATGLPTPMVWDIVEAGFATCHTAVVILSGDEVAKLRPEYVDENDSDSDIEEGIQSRANVLVELGAALAKGRERVVIVQIGKHRTISDIGGFHILHLRDDPASRKAFVGRLRSAGAELDDTGGHYLTAGDLKAAIVPYVPTMAAAPVPTEPQEDPCPPGSPQERVLALLFASPTGGRAEFEIAPMLQLGPGELAFFVDVLERGNLANRVIRRKPNGTGGAKVCYITPEGRKVVMQRNLHKASP